MIVDAQDLIQTTLLGEAAENAPLGIFVADDEMGYVAVNRRACELLGYEREELLSLTIADVSPVPPSPQRYGEMIARGELTGKSRLLRKDGSEVESALVDHPSVAEAAVCGRKDETTGQAIVAFVSLKGGDEGSPEMMSELREHVAKRIGKIARPANLLFTPELPKTRSGKIMRRLLRDVAENRALGDTTTLADPAVVEEIKERATAEASKEG